MKAETKSTNPWFDLIALESIAKRELTEAKTHLKNYERVRAKAVRLRAELAEDAKDRKQ